MTHRYHPDEGRGDPPDALLYDDCDDCVLYLRSPASRLDDQRLRLAVSRALDPAYRPTTRAESLLLHEVRDLVHGARRLVRQNLLGEGVPT